jgi:hypothetical protein
LFRSLFLLLFLVALSVKRLKMIRLISGLFKFAVFAVILIFAIYNFELVTLQFANVYELNLPLAVLLFLVFVLGLTLGSTMTWVTKLGIKDR